MDSERFYCVSCQTLEQKFNGEVLFKTGFFRVVYPLGCCVACLTEETAKQYSFMAESAVLRAPAAARYAPKPLEPVAAAFSPLEWAAV